MVRYKVTFECAVEVEAPCATEAVNVARKKKNRNNGTFVFSNIQRIIEE